MSDNRCKTCGSALDALIYRIAVDKTHHEEILKDSYIQVHNFDIDGNFTITKRRLNDCCIFVIASHVNGADYQSPKGNFPLYTNK